MNISLLKKSGALAILVPIFLGLSKAVYGMVMEHVQLLDNTEKRVIILEINEKYNSALLKEVRDDIKTLLRRKH